ncbi:MAG: lysophospholipid acyltransferase family protein [Bacteroidota bacterium]
MTAIVYYLLLYPLSLLPMRVLQGLSTGVFYLLYHVIGYRKKVVFGNLTRSFPEKTAAEIEQIARQFYRHLCDLIVESVKMFSIPKREMADRIDIANPDFLAETIAHGRHIILFAGHYNSWEMVGCGFPYFTDTPVAALYSPIKNKFLERVMTRSRSRHGLEMIPKSEAKTMFATRPEPTIFLFGGDQSPSSRRKTFWMEFLNQETAVAFGTERFAKEHNCVVIYGHIRKQARGRYDIVLHPITSDAAAEPYGAITTKHTRLLEQHIRAAPQYWLWTHRRWKRNRQEEEGRSSLG